MSGLSYDHPKYLAIEAIIKSKQGQAAMDKAIADGLPPLCGVDRLLSSILAHYSQDDDSIGSAGAIIANLMQDRGYTRGKSGQACPAGCSAKTGTTWLPPV